MRFWLASHGWFGDFWMILSARWLLYILYTYLALAKRNFLSEASKISSLYLSMYKYFETWSKTIAELQNSWGRDLSRPSPIPSQSARAGCLGQHLVKFWVSLQVETLSNVFHCLTSLTVGKYCCVEMELQPVPIAPCPVTDHHLEGPDSTFDVPFHQTSEHINKIPCLSFLFHGLKCPRFLNLTVFWLNLTDFSLTVISWCPSVQVSIVCLYLRILYICIIYFNLFCRDKEMVLVLSNVRTEFY